MSWELSLSVLDTESAFMPMGRTVPSVWRIITQYPRFHLVWWHNDRGEIDRYTLGA